MRNSDLAALSPASGVWTWDVRRDLVFSDAAVSHLFNLSPSAGAAGQPMERMMSVLHPTDRRRLDNAIRVGLKQGPFFRRYRLTTKRLGERRIIVTGSVFTDAEGTACCCPGHIVDVTDTTHCVEVLARRIAEGRSLAETLDHSGIIYLLDAISSEIKRLRWHGHH